MIARLLLPLLVAMTFPFAAANPPLIIVQKPAPSTVVSPLTSQPSQANQQLLNQVQSTLTQRQTTHQLSTIQAALRSQPVSIAPAVVIQPK